MKNDGEIRACTPARLQKLVHDEASAKIQHEHWEKRLFFLPNDPFTKKEAARAKKMWETRRRWLDAALYLGPVVDVQLELTVA